MDPMVLREHASSDDVLATIPTKAQYGFKNVDVRLTCMDAEKTHLLFGTNIGAAFLFNRELGSNIKLLSESRHDVVTAVKLLIGIEHQAALGTEDGKLTIVILSHSTASATRHVRKYCLENIHRSAITCMEWSSNGMKLFTGDKGGNIYVSDLDFEKNQCNASLLHTEEHGIVQLCYKHQTLLVSSSERTILFHINNGESKITPVGSKPSRRGLYGACFNSDTISAADLKMFCTRPGFRIWIANIEGKVTSTLQLKDLVQKDHPKLEILDSEEDADLSSKEMQFGQIVVFSGGTLVSFSENAIFIIGLNDHSIIGSVQSWNDIISVTATDDEIFVLRSNRRLHRISDKPDETAVKRRLHLEEEEKKREAQALNIQGSLSDMKRTFTPLVGALQSKMTSLNAEAGQWTQKIQTQAKVLQKKLPVPSIFTPKDASTRSDPPSPTPSRGSQRSTTSEEEQSDGAKRDPPELYMTSHLTTSHSTTENSKTGHCDFGQSRGIETNEQNEVCNVSPSRCDAEESPQEKTKNGGQEFLHSQGDPERALSVEGHFEKLDKLMFGADTDIVFNSKRKKKRASSSSKSSLSMPSPEKPPKYVTNGEHFTSELHSSREAKLNEATASDNQQLKPHSATADDSTTTPHSNGDILQTPNNITRTQNPPVEKESTNKDKPPDTCKIDSKHDPTESAYIGSGSLTPKDDQSFHSAPDKGVDSKSSSTELIPHGSENHHSIKHGATEIDTASNVAEQPQDGDGETHNLAPTGQKTSPTPHTSADNPETNRGAKGVVDASDVTNPPQGGDRETHNLASTVQKTQTPPNPETNCGSKGVVDASDDTEPPHGGNRDTQDLVIAVHKTSGNQLFPEIVKTPVEQDIQKGEFDFTTAIQGTSTTPELGSMSPTKSSITPTGFSAASDNHPLMLEKIASNSGNLTSSLNSPEVGNLRKITPKEYKPLFSDAESDDSDFLKSPSPVLDSGPDASLSEDIYKVESGTMDFESEIDSDVDPDAKSRHEVIKKSVRFATSSSVSSSFQDISSLSGSVPVKISDNWSTGTMPHQVISISGSSGFIWYIDYYDHVYITEETTESVCNSSWKKLAKKGMQLCISASGDFAWLLSRSGKVYASVMPSELHLLDEPIKLEWQQVGAGVSKVALGVDSAWAATQTGGIKAQFGLSRSNPFVRGWDLVTWNKDKISHIVLTKSTVWCRTDGGKLFAAEQAKIDSHDFAWEEIAPPVKKDNTPAVIQSITSDLVSILWAVDERGSLWFLTEDRQWWQVNLSQYIDEKQHLVSHSFMQSLPLPAKVSDSVHKVQRWMNGIVKVQHVAVNTLSVWVVYDKHKVNISRGPLTGCRWDVTTPLGVAKSTRWHHISTSSVFSSDEGTWLGLVWAAQSSNEIFCFPSADVAKTRPVTLTAPLDPKARIVCMSACKEALWVLTNDGTIYIRSGISSECLQGTEWNELDTSSQLGNVKIVHVSCGTQNVWALDSNGMVYFRIGITPVDRHSLPHAWIPIEGCQTPGCHFTQIECGLSDASVWAIDNLSNVYVRTGVSFTLPVGDSWEDVPGSHAQQLCISNHTVWGLRLGGNVIRRYGISDRNLLGNYWKKIEGKFKSIAVTPYDELWAIDLDQRLRHRYTSIYCPPVVEAQYKIIPNEEWSGKSSADQEWEFV